MYEPSNWGYHPLIEMPNIKPYISIETCGDFGIFMDFPFSKTTKWWTKKLNIVTKYRWHIDLSGATETVGHCLSCHCKRDAGTFYCRKKIGLPCGALCKRWAATWIYHAVERLWILTQEVAAQRRAAVEKNATEGRSGTLGQMGNQHSGLFRLQPVNHATASGLRFVQRYHIVDKQMMVFGWI